MSEPGCHACSGRGSLERGPVVKSAKSSWVGMKTGPFRGASVARGVASSPWASFDQKHSWQRLQSAPRRQPPLRFTYLQAAAQVKGWPTDPFEKTSLALPGMGRQRGSFGGRCTECGWGGGSSMGPGGTGTFTMSWPKLPGSLRPSSILRNICRSCCSLLFRASARTPSISPAPGPSFGVAISS